ncbi:TPA: autotransporter adhesin BigA [Salmonella enterica subsp. enterica serovar Ball]|uniref:BigA/YdbA N-terminal beta-barrel domain-containing protein n=1 Tax=Salmonella enterica TaxID=28901 RepID=UPI001C458188|nr:autotransporter adhesin BigA [Salmonella enterica]HCA3485980.1 autotransporter adhesin BigA [Salmonella enterica subsp. enterica serovar Ball]HCA3560441.1 autotransporter adhesin BigA [Salmonella enterica subsp. enterica serovar Ball]
MQRKKLLAMGIALALQTSYYPAMAADNTDDDDKCPVNMSSLSQAEREKLPAECLITKAEQDNHWGWAAGGIVALAAGVALGVHNSDNDGNSHHNVSPTPPNNGGDVTPTPPDDSGDVTPTPPDDGGDVTPTPPDDGGDDVTPPDDGGGDDVTPPDDGSGDDVTPPDDGSGDDVTPPDDGSGDDVTPPDDGSGDDVTPPDDGGDDSDDSDVTPPDDTSVITYSNGVTDDRGQNTLSFDDIKLDNGEHLGKATLSYAEQDGQWQLTTPDGNTLNVTGWNVTDTNAAVIEGTQENGLYWKYDSRGYLILADDKTQVIAGDDATNAGERGLDVSSEGRTGAIISGDRTNNTLNGDTAISDGATGIVISGDDTTNTISGHSTVDGATGALISGENSSTTVSGDMTITGGGTGMVIDGNNAFLDNAGITDVNGAGSIGTLVNGEDVHIINEGNVTVSDGGTGGQINGDGAIVDNRGTTTVSGSGSTALSIDGDNALVINEGDQTISDGATGLNINGDNARVVNTGDMNADGENTVGVDITGNDATLTQNGDLLVTNGAQGIKVDGENNQISNAGQTTVHDANSIGFAITGKQNTFNNKGNINISLNGTGTQISGEDTTVNLGGDINVTAEKDSNDLFRGATGVEVSGSNNNTTITGNVNLSGQFANGDKLSTSDTLSGIIVSGNNNTVTLDGALSMDISDNSAASDGYMNTTALDVEGTGNTVNIEHGLNINYSESANDTAPVVSGINVNGANTVTLSGDSLLNLTNVPGGAQMLANIQDGGQLILEEDSTITINKYVSTRNYYDDYAILMADGEGSVIKNEGVIVNNGTTSIMHASNGALVENGGDITSYTRDTDTQGADAVIGAQGEGSAAHNTAGGNLTLSSEHTPSGYNGNTRNPLMWYQGTYYAMLAYEGGEVSNDAGATVSLYGAGVYGVSASQGTALNAGDIYLDGFTPVLDDTGNIVSEDFWSPGSTPWLTSSAMVAGSTDGAYGDGTAINTGTITVNNAGFGMMALDGGTAINQGTITLTADEGVGKSAENQLVGMAAFNGGTVVNDTSGTINIEADYGKPFYADSSSVVINYGQICIGGDCQNSDEYNPTDSYVSDAFKDGDVITSEGETRTNETIITDPLATQTAHITNAGTISGGKVTVNNYGDLTNESTGSISKVNISTGGSYTNNGTTATVSVDGGVFTNTGTVTGQTGTTVAGSVINNSGTMHSVEQWTSTMYNTGSVTTWTGASAGAVLNNNAGGEINTLKYTAAATVNNAGVIKGGSVDKGGTLNNLEGGVITLVDNGLWSGKLNNWGTINGDADIATTGSGHTLYNGSTGVINGQITTAKNSGGSKAINDGTINIDKTGSVAMSAHGSAKMVNNGTINVGTEGTSQTGMVGMQLESDAKSDGVIENNGTINIYASNSYAFSQLGSNGHIVNNGTVYIDDSVTGSGFIKQDGKTIEGSGQNGDGTEVHYVDFTAPGEPTIDDGINTFTTDDASTPSGTNDLSGYVVGTSADGSAGKLMVNNASMNGVEINTGFTTGTADTTVTFDNVVEGSNLSDASAIQSTSVVWNAQGSTDSSGNVDVTMTKNAYVDVATDSSVSDVAQALDAGYTNNELYTSLNVGTTAELNSALKQVSGSQATTVFREARILSNRFNMLADAAPQIKEGLAFNVVAKGDPRAELGNDTQYDMLALRQTLDLTASQNLTLEYGIARLDGDGSQKAGDNGLTGGYSQFFGLKHSMAFEDGLAWNNALRYDVHNLDSSRSVSYGDINKVADSDARQQYMEFRSEGAKTFSLMDDALKVTPYAGVKFRHTMEDGYKERSAGDFNLSMNSGNETAVDSIVGLKLDYAGKDGWSATATLEGGPNLSYSKSQRTASLQGAAGQTFNVDDDQKGGGINGLATIGVKYSNNDTALHLDAYQWKEDGISDKGFMLNVKKTFR